MSFPLECCKGLPVVQAEPGTVLLTEGATSGRIYVLIEGAMQVLRGDVEVAAVTEPGAVFGEMAILLSAPHTASVKARAPSRLYLIEDAERFLAETPELMGHIGKLLALRLQLATGYLADLKRQYADSDHHLGMVDVILGSLLHHQHDEAGYEAGGSERAPDPNR